MANFNFTGGRQTHIISFTWVDRTSASYPATYESDDAAIQAALTEAREIRCAPCNIKVERFRGAVIYNAKN